MFHNVKKILASGKAKRCYWCCEMIEAGSPKVTTSGVWEGDFYHSNFHPECYVASEQWLTKYRDDEFPDEGSMLRGSTEPKYY
jgi:hypothetical protein